MQKGHRLLRCPRGAALACGAVTFSGYLRLLLPFPNDLTRFLHSLKTAECFFCQTTQQHVKIIKCIFPFSLSLIAPVRNRGRVAEDSLHFRNEIVRLIRF